MRTQAHGCDCARRFLRQRASVSDQHQGRTKMLVSAIPSFIPQRLTRALLCVVPLALSFAVGSAFAQMPSQPASASTVIYPAKGQDAKQQDQDKYECYSWSKGQSGFDPAQPTQQAAASPQQNQTSHVAGGMVV